LGVDMGAGVIGRRLGLFGLVLLLGGCGGMLLPSQSELDPSAFATYDDVQGAFDRITLEKTSTAELARLGFDPKQSPNVSVLSYLDVVERFMPNSSVAFDRLDPAVQACIFARTACEGYVFKAEHHSFSRSGSLILDLFGFVHTTTETGWTAQVLVLVMNGHVTHKIMSGQPNIQVVRDDVQPLGPVQNLGGALTTASGVALKTIR